MPGDLHYILNWKALKKLFELFEMMALDSNGDQMSRHVIWIGVECIGYIVLGPWQHVVKDF